MRYNGRPQPYVQRATPTTLHQKKDSLLENEVFTPPLSEQKVWFWLACFQEEGEVCVGCWRPRLFNETKGGDSASMAKLPLLL